MDHSTTTLSTRRSFGQTPRKRQISFGSAPHPSKRFSGITVVCLRSSPSFVAGIRLPDPEHLLKLTRAYGIFPRSLSTRFELSILKRLGPRVTLSPRTLHDFPSTEDAPCRAVSDRRYADPKRRVWNFPANALQDHLDQQQIVLHDVARWTARRIHCALAAKSASTARATTSESVVECRC